MRVTPGRFERLLTGLMDARRSYGGVLTGLYGATFCIRASFGITVVLLSAYLPLPQAVYGFFIATTPLAELIAVPFVGIANDRYGRRAILIGGLGLAGVSLAGRVFTQDLFPHIVLNAFHGVSAALILVTSLALLADWAAADSRGREMGIFDFVNLFGWMVGFIVGLLAKDLLTLRIGFWLASAIAFVGVGVAAWTVREPRGPKGESQEVSLADIARVAANPRIALVLGPWLILFIFIGSFSGFLERLSAAVGLTGVESALGLAVLSTVLLASQVGYGKLSDRYGRGPLIMLGAWGFFAFTTTVAFLALHTAEGGELRSAAVLEAMPVFGPFLSISFLAMLAFAPAALAALADEAQKGPSGVTMSLYSLVVGLGFIIGPSLTGSVVQFTGSAGLAVLLFVEGLGLVLLVTLRNTIARQLT
ncbi:MAG: MFS transporter [Candidatus Thermoplasmatota archaeon]|nr:MFS transporter [Candidatus Thermoplasmatota archaeon]